MANLNEKTIRDILKKEYCPEREEPIDIIFHKTLSKKRKKMSIVFLKYDRSIKDITPYAVTIPYTDFKLTTSHVVARAFELLHPYGLIKCKPKVAELEIIDETKELKPGEIVNIEKKLLIEKLTLVFDTTIGD